MSQHGLDEAPWLAQVRRGEFSAMPQPFPWQGSGAFAHLLHGYDVSLSLGLGELAGWANERLAEAEATGTWPGSAIELWLCLFYEHRRYRHFGHDPSGPDLDLLNRLCRQLRDQLQQVGQRERATILRHIALSASS